MNASRPKFLDRAQLEKLPTKRLLAYRASLFRFHEGPSHDVTDYGEVPRELNKQSPEWREAMSLVKEVLATREHVPNRREVAQ